jgi:hypothetical protein
LPITKAGVFFVTSTVSITASIVKRCWTNCSTVCARRQHRYAVIFRSVAPEQSVAAFIKFMRQRFPGSTFTDADLASMYAKYGIDKFNLQDRGYLAHVHPLELWLLGYLRQHPEANLTQIVDASRAERQSVYEWLFKSKAKRRRTARIRTLLEMEAFTEIHKHWKRLGLSVRLARAVVRHGDRCSGDRPAALAELMGII